MYIPFGYFSTTGEPLTLEYIIVAGGGGGGSGIGGGGGAGGAITGSIFLAADSYTITVGDGGSRAADGENSSFFNLTAIGGGAGGSDNGSGSDGGSGGGVGGVTTGPFLPGSGTAGQGNNGGDHQFRAAGGGGGQSEVGGDGIGDIVGGAERGGNGGDGVLWLNGSYYAGGGGGGSFAGNQQSSGGQGGGGIGRASSGTDGGDATNQTGGGGGGGGSDSFGDSDGGLGGSGVVIIRYSGTTQLATGGAISFVGDKTYHTFTNNGTFTIGGEIPPAGSVIPGSVVEVVNTDTGSFFNDRYNGPASLLDIPTTGVSLEIWAKNPSLTQNYDAFIGIWDEENQPDRDWIEIRQVSGGDVYGEIYDQTGGGNKQTNPKSAVADVNEFWHHVLTFDSGSSELLYYRNGQLEGSGSNAELEASANYRRVYVGQQEDGPVSNMYVGEYRIYTSSLDASDVLFNFNGTKTRYGY